MINDEISSDMTLEAINERIRMREEDNLTPSTRQHTEEIKSKIKTLYFCSAPYEWFTVKKELLELVGKDL